MMEEFMRRKRKLVCGGRTMEVSIFILFRKWEKRTELHCGGLPLRFPGFWDSGLVIRQYDLGSSVR